MDAIDDLRARYGRYSDRELELLLAVDGEGLSPEARQVLAEEAGRRGLVTSAALAAPLVQPPASRIDVWHYPKARIGARLLATIIDSVVGIFMPVFAGIIGVATSHGKLTVVNVLLLISSVVWAVYYNFTKDGHDNGRSIGKRWMGLMVVNIKTNKPCSIGESSLRALMLGVLNMLPFGGLIEPMVILFQKEGRRVGDMVAGTQVIEARLYDPDSSMPPGLGAEAPTIRDCADSFPVPRDRPRAR
jgi:uncharacterized RDD family membrane protein YckC